MDFSQDVIVDLAHFIPDGPSKKKLYGELIGVKQRNLYKLSKKNVLIIFNQHSTLRSATYSGRRLRYKIPLYVAHVGWSMCRK